MPCRRYVLYLAWNNRKYRLGISINPQIDLSYLENTEGYEKIAYLSPPLPLALSEYLLNMIATTQERFGKSYTVSGLYRFYRPDHAFIRCVLNRKFHQVRKELQRLGEDCLAVEPVIHTGSSIAIDYYSLNYYEDVLEQLMQGRIFYIHEIARLLREHSIPNDDLEMILHLLVLKGQVLRLPSVSFSPNGRMSCNRCGHQYKITRIFCPDGQKDCWYCQECLMLGESKPCEALYAIPARARPEENYVKSVRLNLDITFSLAQYEAFEALARFVRKDSLDECLVWEVCGGGRMEVVFGAVREVLKRGGRVLFGVPRRDVLEDMLHRLERAFPGVLVSVRYGKARNFQPNSDIVLASTHHVLKYYQGFDLVVLDESDAFPYRASSILINALRRAKKAKGKFIYLTPTPAPEVFARAQRGEMKVIQIPIRPHGFPLSLPQIVVNKELDSDRIPEIVFQFVRESLEEDQAQVLVLVPDSYYSKRVGEWLRERLKQHPISGAREHPVVYTGSDDPERERKVCAYFRGDCNILVTTNLTSRGDLAPKSNMIVLWADREIFDENCLLQLAGRIGWSEEYPQGKVWFVTSRVTRDIEGAVRKIKLLNEEAHKKGYLDNMKQRQNNVKP